MSDLTDLRYPIGRFAPPATYTPEARQQFLAELAACPDELRRATAGLATAQLDTPYRESGWTVRQVVHHLPDSHMNAYVRHKLAATEDQPAIKLYKEALWAEHIDARTMPIEPSLQIIGGSHARWVVLLRNMSTSDFVCSFFHPEQQREISLAEALELYVWHSGHHLAHITELKKREGW